MQKYTDPRKIIDDYFNGRPLIVFFGEYNKRSSHKYLYKILFNTVKHQYFLKELYFVGKTGPRKSRLRSNLTSTPNATGALISSIYKIQEIIENMEL